MRRTTYLLFPYEEAWYYECACLFGQFRDYQGKCFQEWGLVKKVWGKGLTNACNYLKEFSPHFHKITKKTRNKKCCSFLYYQLGWMSYWRKRLHPFRIFNYSIHQKPYCAFKQVFTLQMIAFSWLTDCLNLTSFIAHIFAGWDY